MTELNSLIEALEVGPQLTIDDIKRVRESMGIGIREAKALLERRWLNAHIEQLLATPRLLPQTKAVLLVIRHMR